ncbi:MAG TPA: 3-dehydroquinate synthase [Bacillota bacterium]|nr:3-dehydroquinate synthase [Bacillota bacterium]
MNTVTVHTEPAYSVRIGPGLLGRLGELLPSVLPGCKIAVITDDVVSRLYGPAAEASLKEAGYPVSTFVFPNGEAQKTLSTFGAMLDFLSEEGFDRSDGILALGGGVTGDMAGFAAACYLRGIRFVQVPTTFLAAVDSSVGGKTGINLNRGKNLAGAFYQPQAVFCDTDVLHTLPDEIYDEGTAEAVKCAVIGDPTLFGLLGKASFSEEEVIRRCVALKASVVEQDEKEEGLRAILNFGHTLGHAIEVCSNYTLRHGRAVALGMIAVTRAAEKSGFAEKGTLDALRQVLEVRKLWGSVNEDPERLLAAVGADKKKRKDRLTLVLPRRIGACEPVSMNLDEAKTLLRAGLE